MNSENNNRKQSKYNLQNEYERIIKAEEDLNQYKSTQKSQGRDVSVGKKNTQNKNISYRSLSGHPVKEETIYSTNKKNKKKTKRWKIVLSVLSIFLVVLIGVGYIFIDKLLGGITVVEEKRDSTKNVEKIYDEDEFPIMHDPGSADSLNDYMEQWYNNGGTKMYSKNVVNVLLMGTDNDEGTGQSRSDSIMLVSLNRKTKKISLVSFMRDSYSYFKIDNSDYHTRINASFFYGGASSMVKTVENLYKIEIDYYATIDFESFKKMIDTLGGVTVKVQQYEAEYINRTSSCHIDYGDAVKLNGKEALVFSRIRHSDADSDVSRTRRQRQVVTALINSMKGASITQLTKVVKDVTPYISTNATITKMLSLGKDALIYNWISYEMQQNIMPTTELLKGITVDEQSVLAVDFPKAAQAVQNMIFGRSNIVLNTNRINPLNLEATYNPYNDTNDDYNDYNSTPSYNDDNDDDEVITVPETSYKTTTSTTENTTSYEDSDTTSGDSNSIFE